jgi:hypothetical protein
VVPQASLELARLSSPDSESGASTNSAIGGRSISVVSLRDSSACALTSTSLHIGWVQTKHIPPGRRRGWPLVVLQRHTRNGAARWDSNPRASTLATLRSTRLSYGCMICESPIPPVRDATRGKFLRITHRRHSAGEFTAARSLQWRLAASAIRGCCVRNEICTEKQKGPESTWETGPLVRELGRYAPTRYLHPGAADPHTAQATRRPGTKAWSSAASSSWMTSDCDHHKTRRARTPGPMRVECSMCSCLLSRCVQCGASSRCVERVEAGRSNFVDGCTVNWLY